MRIDNHRSELPIRKRHEFLLSILRRYGENNSGTLYYAAKKHGYAFSYKTFQRDILTMANKGMLKRKVWATPNGRTSFIIEK